MACGLHFNAPMQAFLKTLGQNIKEARLRAGLRQIDVNEQTGLAYRHYQNIEAGRINVTITTLCKLAKLFKTRLDEMIGHC